MFHAVDSAHAPPPGSPSERQAWLAVLARAPLGLLESALADHAAQEPRWLRRPETGLMMIQGRAGGTGQRFNLGEVTITRCALRAPGASQDAPVGIAYVLGRNHHQARLAAVADALLQDPSHQPGLRTGLLEPARQWLQQQADTRRAQAQTTQVDFFAVARESSDGAGEEEDE